MCSIRPSAPRRWPRPPCPRRCRSGRDHHRQRPCWSACPARCPCGSSAYPSMSIAGSTYLDMPSYRTGTGQGTHSNKAVGGGDLDPTGTGAGTAVAAIDAALTDVSSTYGDFTLVAGSNPAVDAGIVLDNLTKAYNGSAPDLGAVER